MFRSFRVCVLILWKYLENNMESYISFIVRFADDLEYFSFRLGSSYNSASVTSGKRKGPGTQMIKTNELPLPFAYLDIIKTKGSSGKCWVFHKDEDGKFLGFLFPSGYRIRGIPHETSNKGEFFMENRNFLVRRYGY